MRSSDQVPNSVHRLDGTMALQVRGNHCDLTCAEHPTQSVFEEEGAFWLGQLFLLPVVYRNSSMDAGANCWSVARPLVGNALRQWFSPQTRLTSFGLVTYAFLANWPPEVLQQHVLHLHNGQQQKSHLCGIAPRASMEIPVVTFPLPAHAPRLEFILLGACTPDQWPSVLPLKPYQHQSLLQKVTFSLEMASSAPITGASRGPEQLSREVLPLDTFGPAMSAGLQRWLELLHQRVGIGAHSVLPDPANSDQINVLLVLEDAEVPMTKVTLLRHQLGQAGLSEVLRHLQSLCPSMDSPVDCNLQSTAFTASHSRPPPLR